MIIPENDQHQKDNNKCPKNIPTTATKDQIKALNFFENYLTTNFDKQLLLFIHGGPGVGKTWTINEFKSKLSHANEKFLCTAYTGAAASLLAGGETIHSLFQIPVGKNVESIVEDSLSDTSLRHLHWKFRNCRFIIIDEISMVGSSLFYIINARMQQVMGNNMPFGGINIVVLGDFFQIIPVGDS